MSISCLLQWLSGLLLGLRMSPVKFAVRSFIYHSSHQASTVSLEHGVLTGPTNSWFHIHWGFWCNSQIMCAISALMYHQSHKMTIYDSCVFMFHLSHRYSIIQLCCKCLLVALHSCMLLGPVCTPRVISIAYCMVTVGDVMYQSGLKWLPQESYLDSVFHVWFVFN